MNKTLKKGRRTNNTRRGIIGIEAAIVMIAFVIVAAALSFVVLNMGFSTTQKAKTSISDSLEETQASMELAGKVTSSGWVTQGELNSTTIPVKTAGQGKINLDDATAQIRYISNSVNYDNIYDGMLEDAEYNGTSAALDAAVTKGIISSNPLTESSGPNATAAVVWFAKNTNNNKILDNGELAMMTIVYKNSERPVALDEIKAEMVLPTGATLSAERSVPSITNSVVDMG